MKNGTRILNPCPIGPEMQVEHSFSLPAKCLLAVQCLQHTVLWHPGRGSVYSIHQKVSMSLLLLLLLLLLLCADLACRVSHIQYLAGVYM